MQKKKFLNTVVSIFTAYINIKYFHFAHSANLGSHDSNNKQSLYPLRTLTEPTVLRN
jgi:hypothetical protein